MATITNNDIAKAIYLASKDNSSDIATQTMKFFVRKRLMPRAPDIISRLEKIIHKAENKIAVKVTSATKLEHANKNNLEHFLKQRYKVKDVLFNEVVDTKIIGGIKLEVGDEVIDLTIKDRIQKLQEHLIS